MITNILKYPEISAEKHPEKVAVSDLNNDITFRQTVEISKSIGTVLSGKIELCSPVAVMAEKSCYTVCAFFGTVYAGGFYVLFNPDLPDFRLTRMQEVLQTKVILTDEQNFEKAEKLFSYKCEIIKIKDIIDSAIDENRLYSIREKMIDTDPLYANFTSGSSGVPKAVVVSHRAVIDFTEVFSETFKFSGEDIIGNQAPFDFDVSVKDIYTAMKTGAKLVLIPKEYFSKPTQLLDFICEREISSLTWAVSAVCLISTFHGLDYKTPEKVKRVLFSGEVMPMKHLATWMEHLTDTMFVNLYGPTEITCNCTYHIIDRNRDYGGVIPIGKAFNNERVVLINDKGERVEKADEVGEVCVEGSCVAIGYYNSREQTASRFVDDPLISEYPQRMYKTGDLAKYNENGELVFCGRKDFQIKHMGHRIELEEIENCISLQEGIERCCCLFDSEKDKLYCAYVGTAEKSEIFNALSESLPKFMIPGAFRKIEEMPLTKNGKIDRKELFELIGRKKHGAKAD